MTVGKVGTYITDYDRYLQTLTHLVVFENTFTRSHTDNRRMYIMFIFVFQFERPTIKGYTYYELLFTQSGCQPILRNCIDVQMFLFPWVVLLGRPQCSMQASIVAPMAVKIVSFYNYPIQRSRTFKTHKY